MSMLFSDLITETKHRSTRSQAGTTYDVPIKNAINSSIFRLNREATWRPMRRKTYFTTKTSYSTGTEAGAFNEDSADIDITSAEFLTDGIQVGRRIKLSGDSRYFIIREITSETEITLDRVYTGDDTTTGTYSILGQGEYNLPIQSNHRMIMWHEEYGYPYKMNFLTDQEFLSIGNNINEAIPLHYCMWGEDMVKEHLLEASKVTVVSSDLNDKSIGITIFGTVANYPDYEEVATDAANGTTAVESTKTFTSVERISKDATTAGRITVTANSDETTVAVIPANDVTAGILYKKVQIYPLPDTAFDMNVYYYKDPYRLVNDDDIHEFGQEFDEAIILLATSKIKLADSQKEADKYFALYRDEVRNLRKTNTDKPDWFPTLKRPGEGNMYGGRRVHPFLSSRQVGSYF